MCTVVPFRSCALIVDFCFIHVAVIGHVGMRMRLIRSQIKERYCVWVEDVYLKLSRPQGKFQGRKCHVHEVPDLSDSELAREEEGPGGMSMRDRVNKAEYIAERGGGNTKRRRWMTVMELAGA